MNCIVTCGPTYEPLDQVRRLTNFSTGRLGVELGNHLVEHGCAVTLLKGEGATYDGKSRAQEQMTFTTTADLQSQLQSLAGTDWAAVFHAAAVCDFSFGQVLRKLGTDRFEPLQSGKFTTREMPLYVELVPTPKILPQLAHWFPQALRVGWKYEVDGERDSALARGGLQLTEAKVNYTVVNGPAYGGGFAIVGGGDTVNCTSREELYHALFKLIPVGELGTRF